jgi:hypothetical protein
LGVFEVTGGTLQRFSVYLSALRVSVVKAFYLRSSVLRSISVNLRSNIPHLIPILRIKYISFIFEPQQKPSAMKQIITLFLLLNTQFLFSQSYCDQYLSISFDDTNCLSRVTIDTLSYHHNIWQIGTAQKSMMDPAACDTRVIVTDTMNPYPVNDTSVFIIRKQASMGIVYGCTMFNGRYYVQSDSLKDYGKIEFSPDRGQTWIDMINDTAYNDVFQWYIPKPVLTGHTGTCQYFDAVFCDVGSVFNLQYGDTMLFRFTFISDSIFDNLCGLMFDNFSAYDFVEGISEIRFRPIKSKIYPNPVSEIFTIEFENPLAAPFELAIYDIKSKLVYKQQDVTGTRVSVDADPFKPGIYIYKLTDLQHKKRCWGKFVTTE